MIEEQLNLRIMNKTKFTKLVEEYVYQHDVNYIEAVVGVCREKDLDPGQVKPLLSTSIVESIEAEARDLNFLPKVDALF